MSCANMAESMLAEQQLYELCVKNGFFDFAPVATGRPRRKSAPEILLSTNVLDVCRQEPAKQPSSVPEVQVRTTVSAFGKHSHITTDHSQSFKTLMLRDVPCKVNLQLMRLTMTNLGFAGTYDYLYFPTRRNGSNLGFGFVNFMKEEDADRFEIAFTGYQFPGIRSSKQCYVTLAEVQGREANLQLNTKCSASSSSSAHV
eukprot:TRINITY_DN11846_c0_g1_i1.p1 TRINITY_DN11846_c0_g1~~TRINITY_DN11846_c0_g1_i1.p1  ORF type:complete len:200 (+),score=25.86 TRINITY_DN11846_c0_g1_i1:58-657(+)